MSNSTLRVALVVVLSCSASALGQATQSEIAKADPFVAQAEKELADLSVQAYRAEWINETYLTEDTDALAAEIKARRTELSVRFAKGAAKFDGVKGLSFDVRRKLDFLKQGIVLPAPEKPGAANDLSTLATKLQSQYGKGKGTLDGKPINGSDIEAAMGTVRDPSKLNRTYSIARCFWAPRAG